MPDAPACPPMQVAGNFTISNSLDVTTFANVTSLTGTLNITGSSLGDINLPCLESAGGIQVPNSVSGLNGLALPHLAALTGGQAYPGDLVVYPPASLSAPAPSLSAPALTTVAGSVALGVAQLDLSSLVSVGGDLTVTCDAARLTSLAGLGHLTSVGGDAYVAGTGITNLSGLQKLVTVGGKLRLTGSDLADLSALSNLTSVTSLDVRQLANGASLHGLEGLTAIPGNLLIDINADLTGLGNITSVGGNVQVSASSLDGLGKLQTIGGYAQFTSVTTTSGLAHLATVELVFSVSAADVTLPALTSVSDFFDNNSVSQIHLSAPLLTKVPGQFEISNDPLLPKCYADRLLAQLNPPAASPYIAGLNTSGTCP